MTTTIARLLAALSLLALGFSAGVAWAVTTLETLEVTPDEAWEQLSGLQRAISLLRSGPVQQTTDKP